MFSSQAWAQAAQATGPTWSDQLPFFAIIFAIFFFFILRPQQKRAQAQRDFQTSLKKGSSVLTSGGIMGTIEGLTDTFVTLQIANGVKIKVLRSAIASAVNPELEKTT